MSSAAPPLRSTVRPPFRVRGLGVIELVVALALLGVLGSLVARGLSRLQDRWAVIGAGDAVEQLVREARGRAVARGGAQVTISSVRGDLRLEAGGVLLRTLDLGPEFGVGIDLGGVPEAVLTFDPAGVGRMASRTLDLVRGEAGRRLVVSTYGRVR